MPEPWVIVHYVWAYGGDLALALSVAAALRWGGRAERWAAAILLAGTLLTLAVVCLRLESVYGPHVLTLVIDASCLVAFVVLSLRMRKLSTLLLAAFSLNDVLTYPAAWLAHMDAFTFVTAIEFWGGWSLIVVLAWATWRHARQADRQGRQAA